jgi:hypothetical protein
LLHLFLTVAPRSRAWELIFVMVCFPSAEANCRLGRGMYRLHYADTSDNTCYRKKKELKSAAGEGSY